MLRTSRRYLRLPDLLLSGTPVFFVPANVEDKMKVNKVDHICIAVKNLDESFLATDSWSKVKSRFSRVK
jgi:hypothetical protein